MLWPGWCFRNTDLIPSLCHVKPFLCITNKVQIHTLCCPAYPTANWKTLLRSFRMISNPVFWQLFIPPCPALPPAARDWCHYSFTSKHKWWESSWNCPLAYPLCDQSLRPLVLSTKYFWNIFSASPSAHSGQVKVTCGLSHVTSVSPPLSGPPDPYCTADLDFSWMQPLREAFLTPAD